MASVIHESPYQDRRATDRRHVSYPAFLRTDGMKVSWGGIFGGVLVAVGVLMLLTALGLAVGISAAQPGETEASTLGTGAGIWAGLSLLLALFVGGMVSTRVGAISDRATGFFEGALVWVVSILLMVYFASSGVGMLAGGAFKLLGGATQAIGSAMQGGGETAQAAAEAKQGMAQLMEKAKSSGALEQKAEEVKPVATKAAWITFGALVISLLAAVIGAMVGRRRAITDPKRGNAALAAG
jgi:hypothetical protein